MEFDSKGDLLPDGPSTDRRSAHRCSTHRGSKFSALRGKGFLREGVVTDISRNGLQIHTYDPEPPGTMLQIEIQPRDSDPKGQLLLVRGRVARVTALSDGRSAMGVRMHVTPRDTSVIPPSPFASARHAQQSVEAATLQISSLQGSPIALTEEMFQERPRSVVFVKEEVAAPAAHRGRRWAAIAVALLMLGLLLFWGSVPRLFPPVETHAGVPGVAQPETLQAAGPPVPVGRRSVPGDSARLPGREYLAVGLADGARSQAQALAGAREASWASVRAAADPGAAAGAAPPAAAVERFVAELGRATRSSREGDKAQALGILDSALAGADAVAVADVWRAAARSLRARLERADAALPSADPLADAFELVPDDGEPGVQEEPWLDVNKTAYVLTLFNQGRPARRFAAGLGRNDSTPPGRYRIVNKITNPDWYNRGEVVKAGDARNPLGRHWMGLGVGGVATSYGIHSTTDPDTLGQPMSRGCIRVLPEDSDALFRLCPIGTLVVIHP